MKHSGHSQEQFRITTLAAEFVESRACNISLPVVILTASMNSSRRLYLYLEPVLYQY